MQLQRTLGIAIVEDETMPPFGKQTIFVEDMKNASRDLEVNLFVFSPLNWTLDSPTVKGYTFDRVWEPVEMELPQMVYDRSFSLQLEEKEHLETFKQYIVSSGRRLLNPLPIARTLIDKLSFLDFLKENGLPVLPYFRLSEMTSEGLASFLATGNHFYLKPVLGSRGRGIHILEKVNEAWRLRQAKGTEPAIEFDSIESLYVHFVKEFGGQRYFLEEGANVPLYQGAVFDFRVMVQNSGSGEYAVSGIGVRVGEHGSGLSNLNAGGKAIAVEQIMPFLANEYEGNPENYLTSIRQLCLSCTQNLHDTFGELGEVAFDILLTKDKGPVFLEGNGKPSRWVFNLIADRLSNHPELSEFYRGLRRETVRMPIVYASKNLAY